MNHLQTKHVNELLPDFALVSSVWGNVSVPSLEQELWTWR